MKQVNLIFIKCISMALLVIFALGSCKKGDTTSVQDQVGTLESMEDNAVADFAFGNASDEAYDLAMQEDNKLSFESSYYYDDSFNGRNQRCADIKIEPTPIDTFPIKVTIDFKDGCVGRDGKIRKGKVLTVYSGRMRTRNSQATTNFENFFIENINVDGTCIITNVSENGVPAFRRIINNGKLTWTNSDRWIRWSSTRTIAMIGGASTQDSLRDDIFRITGNGGGENSNGKTWTHDITEALIKKRACRWVSAGTIQFRHNSVVGSLNYGNGGCDEKALLTVNDRSKEITLR